MARPVGWRSVRALVVLVVAVFALARADAAQQGAATAPSTQPQTRRAPRYDPNRKVHTFDSPVGDLMVTWEAWVPDDVPVLRGTVACMWGFGCREDPARALGVALLSYYNEGGQTIRWDNGTPQQSQDVLDTLARLTKHPELSNAPLAMMGPSSGGSNSLRWAKVVPERTITYACVWSRSPAPEAGHASLLVPGVWIVGSADETVKPGLVQPPPYYASWRALDAETAMAVDWGGGHGHDVTQYQEWELVWFWVSECMRLRCPAEPPSTVPGNPVALKTIKLADGWLGDAVQWGTEKGTELKPLEFAEPWTTIAPAAEYKGDARIGSWMPTKDAAIVYRALNSIDDTAKVKDRKEPPFNTELNIVAPAPFPRRQTTGYEAGDKIPVTVDARNLAKIARIEIYDGSTLLAVSKAADEGTLWRFTYTPEKSGIRALVAVATLEDGTQTSTFRCVAVNNLPATATATAFSH